MKRGVKAAVQPSDEDVQATGASDAPVIPDELTLSPTTQPPEIQNPKSKIGNRLALNTLIVGGAFVVSRVLGLVREAVLAGQFGTGPQYDAYVAAFRVPDTLFLLIIGGAVGSAFIPVFTAHLRKGDEESAWNLASTLINASMLFLGLGGILMGLFAPHLVATLIAPAMSPSQQALVVDLTRILLLSPLFMGLGGWAMGILNARQNFTLPALAPVAYNLAIIAGALFLAPAFGIYGLAWGVVVGALLHFGVQTPGLWRAAMRYSPRLNLRDSGVSEVSKLLLPRILGQAAFQVNIIAMTNIGSFLPVGRISALNYAYLLMMLPHGVFALSLATVTFPTMSAQYAEGDLDGLRATLARAVKVLLFLTLPSAAGLLLLRSEVVVALFQFGQFNRDSTELVASALGFFALGLVAYALVEVLTRAFYALHDTKTPVAISLITVLLNLGLSFTLVRLLGWDHNGLALSLAATTTVEMVLMWVLLGRKLPGWRLSSGSLATSIVKSAVAALIMGLFLFLFLPALYNLMPDPGGKLESVLILFVGMGAGTGIFLAVARLLRSAELNEALSLLLRRVRR
ncbi:MAG: murein biosynthesis integral membrane protein MurJ [Chloroflexia bacterium]